MNRYTIKNDGYGVYRLFNPYGRGIADGMTWRVATDLCRLKNAERDRKRSHPEFVKLAETLMAGES